MQTHPSSFDELGAFLAGKEEGRSDTETLSDSVEHAEGDRSLGLAGAVVGLPSHDDRDGAVPRCCDAEACKVPRMHVSVLCVDAEEQDPSQEPDEEDAGRRKTSSLTTVRVGCQNVHEDHRGSWKRVKAYEQDSAL